MDTLTKQERSINMSKIRSRDTKPENAVRKALTSLGLRYRLHSKKLPGRPDIVVSDRKTAVFINGCFWHQHDGCKRKSMPKTNADYWKPKLEGNIRRQKEQIKEIKKIGFKPLVLWECGIKNTELLADRLKRVFL